MVERAGPHYQHFIGQRRKALSARPATRPQGGDAGFKALARSGKGVTVSTISPGYRHQDGNGDPAGGSGLEDHPADTDGPSGQA
jgi:hypothetical protein